MKKLLILSFVVLSLKIMGEPYRPYPVIYVHGYNANGVDGSSFGMKIDYSKCKDSIIDPIEASPY